MGNDEVYLDLLEMEHEKKMPPKLSSSINAFYLITTLHPVRHGLQLLQHGSTSHQPTAWTDIKDRNAA
jgi:hypothetical protein